MDLGPSRDLVARVLDCSSAVYMYMPWNPSFGRLPSRCTRPWLLWEAFSRGFDLNSGFGLGLFSWTRDVDVEMDGRRWEISGSFRRCGWLSPAYLRALNPWRTEDEEENH